MNALLARNYFNDALPMPAPIPPADSYVVTVESARDIPGASYIDATKLPWAVVLRNGHRIALNMPLCSGCDAPLVAGFCVGCGE